MRSLHLLILKIRLADYFYQTLDPSSKVFPKDGKCSGLADVNFCKIFSIFQVTHWLKMANILGFCMRSSRNNPF